MTKEEQVGKKNLQQVTSEMNEEDKKALLVLLGISLIWLMRILLRFKQGPMVCAISISIIWSVSVSVTGQITVMGFTHTFGF